jgi:hypothetical protein
MAERICQLADNRQLLPIIYLARREGHRPVTPIDGAGAVLADESQSLLSASGLGIVPSGA